MNKGASVKSATVGPRTSVRNATLLTAALNYCGESGLPNPWNRFVANRRGAASRGIDWKLTFDEWWTLWALHYHQRGAKRGDYCLCRYLDSGCYEVGNVRIDDVTANHKEVAVANRLKAQHIKSRNARKYGSSGHSLWEAAQEFLDPLEILLAREAAEAA